MFRAPTCAVPLVSGFAVMLRSVTGQVVAGRRPNIAAVALGLIVHQGHLHVLDQATVHKTLFTAGRDPVKDSLSSTKEQ